jgi:16S rRNA (guanine527-N7)-methyltransferase
MGKKNRAGAVPGAAPGVSAGRRDAAVSGPAPGAALSSRPSKDAIVFPYPADVLLAKGLEELAFREACAGTDTFVRQVELDADTFVDISVRGVSSIIQLVNRYIRELELFNSAFDLVGAETGSEKGRQDLVVRHILDSLAPWMEIARIAALRRHNAVSTAGDSPVQVADAGSGAGFPGIPLSIIFPDMHFTLVERMSKRCAFLENCVAMLGLKNVTVLNSEVERAPAGAFDIVVFRAFRPLDAEMTKTLLRLAKTDQCVCPDGSIQRLPGILAAWKARRDKIDEELAGIRDLTRVLDCVRLDVPFLSHEERHLVVLSSFL